MVIFKRKNTGQIMKSKFNIDHVSDSSHKHLTAEISFDGQILCLISQEKREENIEIEFFHLFYQDKNDVRFKFRLSDFYFIVDEVIQGFGL